MIDHPSDFDRTDASEDHDPGISVMALEFFMGASVIALIIAEMIFR